jgi:hypothetical protein
MGTKGTRGALDQVKANQQEELLEWRDEVSFGMLNDKSCDSSIPVVYMVYIQIYIIFFFLVGLPLLFECGET